jgi:hypothetical protein
VTTLAALEAGGHHMKQQPSLINSSLFFCLLVGLT